MKTARLFFTLFVFALISTGPLRAQGPWEYRVSPNAAITDFNTTSSTITIYDAFTIQSMQVMVDIEHSSAGDLLITLDGPSGSYILSMYNGGVRDNYQNTIFDPNVTAYPCSGAPSGSSAVPGVYVNSSSNLNAGFRGIYRPQPGTVFALGGSAVGKWTIQILDNALGDQGVLKKWGLLFNAYTTYKDVRFGWDLNQANNCGSSLVRLPGPYINDVTNFDPQGYLLPYRTFGARPTGGAVSTYWLVQNSKTASTTNWLWERTLPDGSKSTLFNGDLNLPVGQFYVRSAGSLGATKGTVQMTSTMFQRGDLFMTRNDNTFTSNINVTPGSIGYDNGTAAGTFNLPLNECQGIVYALASQQTISSVDVWQGSNVELEPTNSSARVTVKIWDYYGGEVASTGLRSYPIQGSKWVTYNFDPAVVLPPGLYIAGICGTVAPTTGGTGIGLDQEGSPFDPNGFYSRYASNGVELFSSNGGASWNNEYIRIFGGKMIRPNFITALDFGVVAILNPPANLPSSFTPRVRFATYTSNSTMLNAIILAKVYVINNSTGQTVAYSERRVSMGPAPFSVDVDFDAVSGLASGTYTIKATLERTDDENALNNEYSRQYTKSFAPVTVSHRGPISSAMQNDIASKLRETGADVVFVDRSTDATLPQNGSVIWIGSMNADEATAVRAYAKAGNFIGVLPTAEYSGDVLTNVYSSIATADEAKALMSTTTKMRATPQLDLEGSAHSLSGSQLAFFGKSDVNSDGSDLFGRRISYLANMSQQSPTTRPISISGSDDIRVEGTRFGALSVAQIIAPKALSPRPVVETITNPAEFELAQNYPNPFNPSTNIAYNLPSDAHVTVTVSDLLGRTIATLVDAAQTSGRYITSWNGETDAHETVASGIYMYRLEAIPVDGSASISLTKKMILSR